MDNMNEFVKHKITYINSRKLFPSIPIKILNIKNLFAIEYNCKHVRNLLLSHKIIQFSMCAK